MRKAIFPNRLYVLAGAGIFGAVLAYQSRYTKHYAIREAFKVIGFGEPSLVEHFLAGFAAPAVLVGLIICGTYVVSKPRFLKSPVRALVLGKLRRWLTTRTRPVYVTHWAAIVSFLYTMISLQWEARQVDLHGFFQLNQFLMDVAGGLAFCILMWALLDKKRQRAKRRRSFSLR